MSSTDPHPVAADPAAHHRSLWRELRDAIRGTGADYTKIPLRRAVFLLAVPMVLELLPAAHETLVARAVELARLGFEFESFGGSSISVTAVPALLNADESAKTLQALADDLEQLDRGADLQQALKRIAATTACHAAVKANYPLSYEKMVHILDELRATAYSSVCPHGRPVMLRLTRREIEKNFERI